MPIIKRVFCLDLPTAGYVVGYLEILGAICVAIEILSSIIYFEDKKGSVTFMEINSKTIALVILTLMFVVCVLDLLSAIMLIQGIKKNSHKMILPWLGIKGIGFLLLIPIVSMFFLFGALLSARGNLILLFIDVVCPTVILVLYCYCYIVIYSIYQFIRDGLEESHPIDAEGLYSHFDVSAAVYHNKT